MEHGHLRYSNYVLTLDNLGMYFSPDLPTAVSRNRSPQRNAGSFGLIDESYSSVDLNGVERIIRPLSLRFVLQTLRDSKIVQIAHGGSGEEATRVAEGIAKMRVRGNIPQLSLILTQSAFQHILTTAQYWSHGLRSSAVSTNEAANSSSAVEENSSPIQSTGREEMDGSLIFNKDSEISDSDPNLPTLASLIA